MFAEAESRGRKSTIFHVNQRLINVRINPILTIPCVFKAISGHAIYFNWLDMELDSG